jgi:hypothetical protein
LPTKSGGKNAENSKKKQQINKETAYRKLFSNRKGLEFETVCKFLYKTM